MFDKLRENARTGLDGSPGDPVSAWAEKRIAELEARDKLLKQAVEWFEVHRPQWGPGTLPTWFVDARERQS